MDWPVRVDYARVLNAPSNSILYGGGASVAIVALAVNSTATRKFLRQVSSGVPTWDTLVAGDLGTTLQVQLNSIGLGEAPSSVQGVVVSTLGANNVTGYRVKRFTDSAPTGKFIDYQKNDGTSLFSVDITGAIVTGAFKGSTAVGAAYGGTGIDTSASTGVPFITGGTWSVKSALPLSYTAKATNFTAVSNNAYWITADSVTATLPVSPADGDFIVLANGGTVTAGTTIVGRNGSSIMGSATDMTIDIPNFAIKLVYKLSTTDWRLAL